MILISFFETPHEMLLKNFHIMLGSLRFVVSVVYVRYTFILFFLSFLSYMHVCMTGLFRDAEQQLRSSLKIQPVINTYLDLCNVYLRLDVPNTALDLLTEARYAHLIPCALRC